MEISKESMRFRVHGAIERYLDISYKTDAVMTALKETGITLELWQESIERAEVRDRNFDDSIVPPFYVYDEKGSFVQGDIWQWFVVINVCRSFLDLRPDIDTMEVDNYANNRCYVFERGDA